MVEKWFFSQVFFSSNLNTSSQWTCLKFLKCLPPCVVCSYFNFPHNTDRLGTGQPPTPSPVQVQQLWSSFRHPLSCCSPPPCTLLFSCWLSLPRTLHKHTIAFFVRTWGSWDLSSPNRDWTWALRSEPHRVYPLDLQRIPCIPTFHLDSSSLFKNCSSKQSILSHSLRF